MDMRNSLHLNSTQAPPSYLVSVQGSLYWCCFLPYYRTQMVSSTFMLISTPLSHGPLLNFFHSVTPLASSWGLTTDIQYKTIHSHSYVDYTSSHSALGTVSFLFIARRLQICYDYDYFHISGSKMFSRILNNGYLFNVICNISKHLFFFLPHFNSHSFSSHPEEG